MARGELLIDTDTAKTHRLRVGSVVPVTFAQTGPTRMRVGGIFKYNPLVGSYLTGAGYFRAHFDHPLLDAVLLSTPSASRRFENAIKRALHDYPNLNVQSKAQFQHAEQKNV